VPSLWARVSEVVGSWQVSVPAKDNVGPKVSEGAAVDYQRHRREEHKNVPRGFEAMEGAPRVHSEEQHTRQSHETSSDANLGPGADPAARVRIGGHGMSARETKAAEEQRDAPDEYVRPEERQLPRTQRSMRHEQSTR
jgi:hypothetical protein